MAGKSPVSTALGQMTGFAIGMYAFDQLFTSIMPLAYNCPTAYSTADLTNMVCTNGTVSVGLGGFFPTALTLLQSLLAPIGILGAFFIVWNTLKKMDLV